MDYCSTNGNGDYWVKMNAHMQAESMQGFKRMQQSIDEYAAKAEISAQKEAQIARLREDVRREAECLTDTVSIGPDGEVFFERRFFRRCPAEFEILNVRLREIALLEPVGATNNCNHKVLMLGFQRRFEAENMEYLFLGELGSLRAVKKRMRGVGIVFRCPERKREEILGEFIRACIETASVCKIPVERGFYWMGEQLYYTNEDTMIWGEVMAKC